MGCDFPISLNVDLKGRMIGEGFVHNIFRNGETVYKLAKPAFPDFRSFDSVQHEIICMQYLADKGFNANHNYQLFELGDGFCLKMDYIEGHVLVNDAHGNAKFHELLAKARNISEEWSGPPDDKHASWSVYLGKKLKKTLDWLPLEVRAHIDHLINATNDISVNENHLLFMDSNLNNVIENEQGDLIIIDMDRIVLGDPLYQQMQFNNQNGSLCRLASNTRAGSQESLYGCLLSLDDIAFNRAHHLDTKTPLTVFEKLYDHFLRKW